MTAYNPDNSVLYILANAVLKKDSQQSEISKSGNEIKIKTADLDFELKPIRFRQVSLKVKMAPANTLSSPVILSQVLLAVVSNLAKNAGVKTNDQGFHLKKMPKRSSNQ